MRIAIVNDLPLATEVLRRALALEPRHALAWTAADGAQAVEQCARDAPDLILMDIVMPNVDGVEATRRIMSATPCAILLVTSNVGANAFRVYEAMGHGALDAVDTPPLGLGDLKQGAKPLLSKIDAIERLLADRRTRAGRVDGANAATANASLPLIAIGASAGGPMALSRVLAALPDASRAAIVIVQHVDVQFAAGMAEWLAQSARCAVRLAREGDQPQAGQVLLAGSADHLVFKGARTLGYTVEPRDLVYRPSVDVFFESVGLHWRGPVIGVLLTGMGRDGALGLKTLRIRGHLTIAQDQATSAVYGMPKAAAKLGAAVEILPIDLIAPRLLRALDALAPQRASAIARAALPSTGS